MRNTKIKSYLMKINKIESNYKHVIYNTINTCSIGSSQEPGTYLFLFVFPGQLKHRTCNRHQINV